MDTKKKGELFTLQQLTELVQKGKNVTQILRWCKANGYKYVKKRDLETAIQFIKL